MNFSLLNDYAILDLEIFSASECYVYPAAITF